MKRDRKRENLAQTRKRRKEARVAREFIEAYHLSKIDIGAIALREVNRERVQRGIYTVRAVRA